MLHAFSRTELLIGTTHLQMLKDKKIAIFGIGGVGSFVVEGLARSGIGHFVLIDDDAICLTNINRQIHATHETIGKPKVEVMKSRILSINPQATVTCHQAFYLPDTADALLSADYDYIVDAVDTVTAKIDLVMKSEAMNIPIISCMGVGNKLDPTRLEVTDIKKTSVCPLAKVMRKALKERGIKQLKVVYSKETPLTPDETVAFDCTNSCVCPKGSTRTCSTRRHIPGSVSFVPSVAGMIIAGEVIKDLMGRFDSSPLHLNE